MFTPSDQENGSRPLTCTNLMWRTDWLPIISVSIEVITIKFAVEHSWFNKSSE